ncbi:hypothetical protein SESBI_24697 [Sesbania bispinosa]|nr:hypothetical protein SESBI_24697 [Sesbania bispinosa]
MFAESDSFCFIGSVSSNSAVFVSDKAKMDPEFGLLVRSAIEEYEISIPEEHELIRLKKLSMQECDQEGEKDHQEDNVVVTVPTVNLKLEIPSRDVGLEDGYDESNDGFKTPTSSDHKIPAVLECPGAPKKTKTTRLATKRKSPSCRRRIVLDLSTELESMFPMPFVVDLEAGGKNKKVKKVQEVEP